MRLQFPVATFPAVRRDDQRHEVEYLLSSGVVDPDSNPGKLLKYLCDKYFEGASADLKERNIAMDVFHRMASFDKRSDSIVRVEAYRLRKRLAEFYAGPGRDRPFRIGLPIGHYAPVIEAIPESNSDAEVEAQTGSELPEAENAPPAHPGEPPAIHPPASGRRKWVRIGLAAASVLAVALALTWFVRSRHAVAARITAPAARVRAELTATPLPSDGDIRILPGYAKPRYVDRLGRVWLADKYFHGGDMFDAGPNSIGRAFDPVLFENRRDGLAFSYDIPAKPGKYELRLYFSEFHFGAGLNRTGGETSRLMEVFLNGTVLLHQFDVYSEAAGSETAHIRAFRDVSPAKDGMVHIRFMGLYDRAFVNAIELTPQPEKGIRPIRMIARLSPFVDKQGAVWAPDDYVRGGQVLSRNEIASGAPDPELYEAERYGNFNYAIPVPAGQYTVRLYFDEAYFTKPGERVFNVFTDGRTLLHNFDIVREAGGRLAPVTRTFHNLEPNAQGVIDLSFVPVANYALVNAIEVTSE